MTIALLVEPYDLLFCRDGRPIVAGEGAASGTAIPGPQVISGAIRSALLRQRGHLPADGSRPLQAHLDAVLKINIRGPLLADLATKEPFIPMPADLVGDKPKHGNVGMPRTRLRPQQGIPGWLSPEDAPHAQPLWPSVDRAVVTKPSGDRVRAGDLAAQSGYLTWAGFLAWASGAVPIASEVRMDQDLWSTETRTQVGLNAGTAVAEDGVLFTTRYLRLAKGVGLYVEVDGADDLNASFTMLLGGDRRQASACKLDNPVSWPTKGTVITALTPTILTTAEARCPTDWKSQCLGLAIPGSDPVSGWDLAANGGKGAPRSTRWAIRPGAVWHLEAPISIPLSIGCECASGFGWIARGIAPSST